MAPRKTKADKYTLYQEAVQDAAHDAKLYQGFYRQARGFEARSLREDFCGTFALSCQWIRAHTENTAIALDLDPEPLNYGRRHHYQELTDEQKSRLRILQENVIHSTAPRDLIVAGNFSFFIFQEREVLLSYFKKCLRSLKKDRGMLVLDMAGGPDMISLGVEERSISSPKLGKFTYVWDTKRFDPITHRVSYAIHFKFKGGKTLRNAFTYDWRLWSIPEVRDLLREAGFKKTVVFWDVARSDRSEKHVISERGSNLESWIAYVGALA